MPPTCRARDVLTFIYILSQHIFGVHRILKKICTLRHVIGLLVGFFKISHSILLLEPGDMRER